MLKFKNVKQNNVIDIQNHFPESEYKVLLELAKETFKSKNNIGWVDTVIYNLLRGKPLFNGIEKLKNEKYFGFEYINSRPFFLKIPRYEHLMNRFGHGQSNIFNTLKMDKEHKIVSYSTKIHLITLITIGFNQAFDYKNGEMV